MAVTRAKATTLLNATEMGLFDDSRANALRGHSEAQLARLVTRARAARDRARDLEKRQRLASRKSTGSKSGRSGQANVRTGEKAELLADILTRLDTQHRTTAKAAKAAARAKPAAAAKKTPAKKAATKKAVAKQAATKKAATNKVAAKSTVAKKAAAKKSAVKKTPGANKKTAVGKTTASAKSAGKAATSKRTPATKVVKKATGKAASAEPKPAKVSRASASGKATAGGKISPDRALKNTRKLLAKQNAEASQPKHWDTLGNEGMAQSAPGFQSPQARSKALALHAGETRQAPINGSISTRDRKNQGKRDHRNKPD